jgi:hypothetical protein
MKTCGELELYFHKLMALALDGDEWSALRPDHFIPEEKPQITVTKRFNVHEYNVWKPFDLLRVCANRSYRHIHLRDSVLKNNTVSTVSVWPGCLYEV